MGRFTVVYRVRVFLVVWRVWGFLGLFLKFGKVGVVFKSMASFGSDVLMDMGDYDNSFSSDEELFLRTHRVHQMVFIAMVANVNTLDLFNSNKLDPSVNQLVNHKIVGICLARCEPFQVCSKP